MYALSADPIVVNTSVHWHLGLLGGNVLETVPATPNMPIRVSDASATRSGVGRLSNAAGDVIRDAWHASAVQQPSPLWMQRMLHAGSVQLFDRNERPTSFVSLNTK